MTVPASGWPPIYTLPRARRLPPVPVPEPHHCDQCRDALLEELERKLEAVVTKEHRTPPPAT